MEGVLPSPWFSGLAQCGGSAVLFGTFPDPVAQPHSPKTRSSFLCPPLVLPLYFGAGVSVPFPKKPYFSSMARRICSGAFPSRTIFITSRVILTQIPHPNPWSE